MLEDTNDRLGKIGIVHEGMGDQKYSGSEIRCRWMNRKVRDPPASLIGNRFRVVLFQPVIVGHFFVELPKGRKSNLLTGGLVKASRRRRRLCCCILEVGPEFPLNDGF